MKKRRVSVSFFIAMKGCDVTQSLYNEIRIDDKEKATFF